MKMAKLKAWPRKYLWQAPRGWALKLMSQSDARMGAVVAGKSVVIVGNAKSLLATSQGAEIDAADIIIRLNKGFVTSAEAQGTRTNMVGLTPELTEAETENLFAPDFFLMLIPKMRHYRFYKSANVRATLFYRYRDWLADRKMIGRRPSSGFMAISWMVRLGAARSVTLYGFDFGATPTYYNPDGYMTPHDFAREAEIVREWARAGKISIVNPDHE
ncbi:MAG TPA: hypothetical protein DEF12_12855 [Rhodobacteraceae bacterium]|jgi:hypothetical protein|nr:hypothetical protein [Paracoccaceae bacterium]